MSQPANIKSRIIDALYCEALVLSDEVRSAFDLSGRLDMAVDCEDAARVALSCEALRTTTRMMHALAWLLNHRAFYAGELSEFQLRRYGRLSPDYPGGDRDRLALLDSEIRKLVGQTETFYARLLRLDRGWRNTEPPVVGAIDRLRERLGYAIAS